MVFCESVSAKVRLKAANAVKNKRKIRSCDLVLSILIGDFLYRFSPWLLHKSCFSLVFVLFFIIIFFLLFKMTLTHVEKRIIRRDLYQVGGVRTWLRRCSNEGRLITSSLRFALTSTFPAFYWILRLFICFSFLPVL